MYEVTVIIPNYNGSQYLRECLNALLRQTCTTFETVVVDNGSTDGSVELLERDYTWVKLVKLPENTGFCGAVNAGIKISKTPFVLLLNNDTRADDAFVTEMLAGIKRSKRRFSCQGKMIQYHDCSRMDDGGNYYCALGWGFARGKDKPIDKYSSEKKIFACCAGAAIYRRELLVQLGAFDQEHFAYLEDMDVGYKARIQGYQNVFLPRALVYHVGSGTSGSRYNLFKVRYSSRNNVYLIYKNMPFLQILLNLPFLVAGFAIKFLFFLKKGFGREYLAGIKNGFALCKKDRKVRFKWKNILHYCKIQAELWVNMGRRLRN